MHHKEDQSLSIAKTLGSSCTILSLHAGKHIVMSKPCVTIGTPVTSCQNLMNPETIFCQPSGGDDGDKGMYNKVDIADNTKVR